MAKNFTSRKENYSQWYNELVIRADMAENSAVRGCMVIKPYGYAIWERMQANLDKMFKDTGHQNAYFPLFIPKSFFNREAAHVEGFAKECAVVTHYRLKNSKDGKDIIVDDDAKLEEELIVRPTSETIIWNTYKDWIQSYRDLPLLINQWANVVRWEMRTRLFLRTAEFLWQEGHTAHATKEEAIEETEKILHVYEEFAEKWMALPVLKGLKSPNERFAGAVETYCIEALMQDGKALQAGTSHFLGQNFARAFDVKFLSKENKLEYVWATSWGVSTRLMGALIMAHSDDKGLVLPPKLAPIQVAIVPIYKKNEQLEEITKKILPIKEALEKRGITVKYDDRDTQKPGWKFAEYEFKGIPVRLAIGPRDLENGTIEVARRDTLEKEILNITDIDIKVANLLDAIQSNLYEKALAFREENTFKVDTWSDFKKQIEKGGFILAHWDGTEETEQKIKEETKATIRTIPLNNTKEKGQCVFSGKDSNQRVVFARAY
ncbi:MAG: proline--tRNA ligase [Bacteroidales bacterium]|nr:proline--tRNA ligase [Bacteroidales bacterium]MCF8388069.1 proline--tRNA ligase [Bacteroidales bacterium]MCF8398846.1 proline--tRNA ligase [Bacteroidales bacterium]